MSAPVLYSSVSNVCAVRAYELFLRSPGVTLQSRSADKEGVEGGNCECPLEGTGATVCCLGTKTCHNMLYNPLLPMASKTFGSRMRGGAAATSIPPEANCAILAVCCASWIAGLHQISAGRWSSKLTRGLQSHSLGA